MTTFLTGDKPSGQQLGDLAPIWAVKAADESVTSSTALQDDDELVLALAANATYELIGTLYYTAAVSGGIKVAFTFPALATLTFGQTAYLPGGSFTVSKQAVIGATSGVSTLSGEGGANPATADVTGTLITGANGGNLRLQWAQNGISGSATVVKAGSILRAARIR